MAVSKPYKLSCHCCRHDRLTSQIQHSMSAQHTYK